MLIEVKSVSHQYSQDDPTGYALKDINFSVAREEFVGLVGHTGSGKSTLVQSLNGLLKPTEGQIFIDGEEITTKDNLKEVRQKVGLVFQYPEQQLFEETVFADVAFGPRNLELSDSEVEERVAEALESVNLDYQVFKDKSPFRLSGGQQRRVAIAGILAMKPEVLILDEPIAGLDPKTREELMAEIVNLQQEQGVTIILISHRMEEIAQLADKVLVLDNGELVLQGSAGEVFTNRKFLQEIGLGIPQITEVAYDLKEKGWNLPEDIFSVGRAKEEILKVLRGQNHVR
jgi:energy-coupling factor transport system ATP-binding protein